MTRFFLLLSSVVFLSCGGGKKFRASDSEDKTLYKAINALVKDEGNANARKDLPFLYAASRQRHLNNIEQLRNDVHETNWDAIIREYTALQDIYHAINSSLSMKQLVNAVGYADELNSVRERASAFFYNKAEEQIMNDDRLSLKEAWTLYRRIQQYIPGYKDSEAKMKQALEMGTVDVVIADMTYNDFPVWNFGVPVNNSMERQMVQELGGNYGNSNAARYFTEQDARIGNVQPSILVNISWRNLYFNMSPAISSSEVDRSKKIKQKNPSTGKEEEITVTAKLRITRRVFTARGDLELNIRDLREQKNISWNTFPASSDYIIETATFSGDSRALDDSDMLVVNRKYALPNRYMLLAELYRNVYPQVRNTIQRNTAW